MAKLYRGICEELDIENNGTLRPKGNISKISFPQRINVPPEIRRDGKFNRDCSENNMARLHQIESGAHDGCYLSFSRSITTATRYATFLDGERTNGYVYEVDEELLTQHGVVAHEFPDPEYPGEIEASLRADKNGDLPMDIVIKKYLVFPED
jgi:hypothetical protein